MSTRTAGSPFALGASDLARLEKRAEKAGRRGVLASITVELPGDVDPSAVVLASRRPDDRFFCFEQPDRGGFALAGLGTATVVTKSGATRFKDAAADCRTIGHGALVDGDGPVWVGGFAFADDGGSSPEWSSLEPAQLVVPEVQLWRRSGVVRMTLSAIGEDVVQRLTARAESLRNDPMPLIDPHPVEKARVASAAPPEHFEAAIVRAT